MKIIQMFTWKWEILINLSLWSAYWNPDRATHLTFTTSHRHRLIEIRVNGKMTRRRWPDVAMTMTRWCDESAKVLWRWSNALSHLSYSIIEPSLSRLSTIASNTFLHMCCLKKTSWWDSEVFGRYIETFCRELVNFAFKQGT